MSVRVRMELSDYELGLIDKRIKQGWAVSRPEVIRQALLAMYLRWQWLGDRKFRAEMLEARKRLEKLDCPRMKAISINRC